MVELVGYADSKIGRETYIHRPEQRDSALPAIPPPLCSIPDPGTDPLFKLHLVCSQSIALPPPLPPISLTRVVHVHIGTPLLRFFSSLLLPFLLACLLPEVRALHSLPRFHSKPETSRILCYARALSVCLPACLPIVLVDISSLRSTICWTPGIFSLFFSFYPGDIDYNWGRLGEKI